jgi:hypothetical protein
MFKIIKPTTLNKIDNINYSAILNSIIVSLFKLQCQNRESMQSCNMEKNLTIKKTRTTAKDAKQSRTVIQQ